MKFNKGTRQKRLSAFWTGALVAAAALLIFLVGPAPVAAIEAVQQPGVMGNVQNQGGDQDPPIQEGGGMDVQPEAGPGIQEGDQPGQASQEAEDLGDLPGSGDMTFFDPDSIPESVFPEDADWALNLPVSVSNLDPGVKKLGIKCETLYWKSGGHIWADRWNDAGQERDRVQCGWAKGRIDIDNGAYTGNIIIGIQMHPGASDNISNAYWLATQYECWMYLVGDIPGAPNSWRRPETGPVSPGWRRADANQPFNWQTGLQDIPLSSMPNPPDYDLGDAGDAMEGAVGNSGQGGAVQGQAGGQQMQGGSGNNMQQMQQEPQ